MMNKLMRTWYQPRMNWLSVLLWPLSVLFFILVFFRRFFYKIAFIFSAKLPVPVIIVGNITVGGTGKTPMVIYLIELLKKHGYRPGVVSRGYGGRMTVPTIVTEKSRAEEVGDEPVLIYNRTKVPMVVAKKRLQTAKTLLAQMDCNVIVADDGLQHYALPRDLEILMVDGARGFGNRCLLPAGPLREPVSRLKKVDCLVELDPRLREDDKQNKNASFFLALIPSKCLININNPGKTLAIDELSGQTVHAFAGIANPERFFNTLSAFNIEVIPNIFSDHYAYQAVDFKCTADQTVVMTEKDAVKCAELVGDNAWFLPVSAKLTSEFDRFVIQRLKACSLNEGL